MGEYRNVTLDPEVQELAREIADDEKKLNVFMSFLKSLDETKWAEKTFEKFMASEKVKVLPDKFYFGMISYKDSKEDFLNGIQGLLQDIAIKLLEDHKKKRFALPFTLKETRLCRVFNPDDLQLGLPIFDEPEQSAANVMYCLSEMYEILESSHYTAEFTQHQKDELINKMANVVFQYMI